MTANTGRTVSKWTDFRLHDTSATLRRIPVMTISAVGVTFDETDLTALQDAVKGALPNMPDAPISITGPFDTSAAVAVGAGLSGSHTVLSALAAAVAAGTAVPLSVDIQIGIRHAWESGEPQFGLTASATSGYLLTAYTVDPNAGTYSAEFRLFPGSSLPAWGTAAES